MSQLLLQLRKTKNLLWIPLVGCFLFFLADQIATKGIIVAAGIIAIPTGIGVLVGIFYRPSFGFVIAMWASFFINGITRYVPLPLGLALDIILILIMLAALFKVKREETRRLKSPLIGIVSVWVLFTIFEIFNPEAVSLEAWFYAVRAISFYMIFIICLSTMVFHSPKHFETFINVWCIGGIISALYGLKQQYLGLDSTEQAWLAAGAAETHLLFGKLRVFSFYSDAGQFGAFMAFTALVAVILSFKTENLKRKIFYWITAGFTVWGMAISGTRGAMFVFSGFMFYLFLSKNFKTLIFGLSVISVIFYILKFTFIGQGVYSIQRMRSALNPDDPSFQVRLENQKKFRKYLSTRPFGGGVGSVGYWGQRFSPGTFLAETPPDSHYVRIWAETGIIGLTIHILMILAILGKAFFLIMRLEDPLIKQKIMAIYAGCVGIAVASYGNQVLGQMPTNVFFNLSLAFIFLAPAWDKAKKDVLKSS